jgi:hypothetical protein
MPCAIIDARLLFIKNTNLVNKTERDGLVVKIWNDFGAQAE